MSAKKIPGLTSFSFSLLLSTKERKPLLSRPINTKWDHAGKSSPRQAATARLLATDHAAGRLVEDLAVGQGLVKLINLILGEIKIVVKIQLL